MLHRDSYKRTVPERDSLTVKSAAAGACAAAGSQVQLFVIKFKEGDNAGFLPCFHGLLTDERLEKHARLLCDVVFDELFSEMCPQATIGIR